MFAVLHLA